MLTAVISLMGDVPDVSMPTHSKSLFINFRFPFRSSIIDPLHDIE